MSESKPITRCGDRKCKNYGKPFVDRGYGYPVCPSTPQNHEPIPMNPKYEGQYVKEG